MLNYSVESIKLELQNINVKSEYGVELSFRSKQAIEPKDSSIPYLKHFLMGATISAGKDFGVGKLLAGRGVPTLKKVSLDDILAYVEGVSLDTDGYIFIRACCINLELMKTIICEAKDTLVPISCQAEHKYEDGVHIFTALDTTIRVLGSTEADENSHACLIIVNRGTTHLMYDSTNPTTNTLLLNHQGKVSKDCTVLDSKKVASVNGKWGEVYFRLERINLKGNVGKISIISELQAVAIDLSDKDVLSAFPRSCGFISKGSGLALPGFNNVDCLGFYLYSTRIEEGQY